MVMQASFPRTAFHEMLERSDKYYHLLVSYKGWGYGAIRMGVGLLQESIGVTPRLGDSCQFTVGFQLWE